MAADDIDSLESELDDLEEGGPQQKLMRLLQIGLPIGALLFVVVFVMVVYSGGGDETPVKVATPVLTPEGTTKIQPETPGGMQIPDQDKLVYNQLNQGVGEGKVENILPPPEQPQTPPETAPGQIDTSALVPPAPGEPVLPTVPQTPAPAAPQPPAATAQPAPGTAPTAAPKPGSQTAILQPPAEPKASTAAPSAPQSTSKSATELRTREGIYRIQLASVQSQALAEKAWETQVKQYGDLLSKLTLTVQRAVIQDRGTYYRVQAGPFQDRESADAACRKLKARGLDCLVVRP